MQILRNYTKFAVFFGSKTPLQIINSWFLLLIFSKISKVLQPHVLFFFRTHSYSPLIHLFSFFYDKNFANMCPPTEKKNVFTPKIWIIHPQAIIFAKSPKSHFFHFFWTPPQGFAQNCWFHDSSQRGTGIYFPTYGKTAKAFFRNWLVP